MSGTIVTPAASEPQRSNEGAVRAAESGSVEQCLGGCYALTSPQLCSGRVRAAPRQRRSCEEATKENRGNYKREERDKRKKRGKGVSKLSYLLRYEFIAPTLLLRCCLLCMPIHSACIQLPLQYGRYWSFKTIRR